MGCIAGAVLVDQTRRMAEAAGLAKIVLTPKTAYMDAKMEWNDPLYRKIAKNLPRGARAGDYITSLDVAARKAGKAERAAEPGTVYSPQVAELVAIGAAIAANCEPCFRHHYGAARKHRVSRDDIAKSVAMAQAVKEAPARAILALARKYTGGAVTAAEAGAPPAGTCCGSGGKQASAIQSAREHLLLHAEAVGSRAEAR